jgi:hypothetical protein
MPGRTDAQKDYALYRIPAGRARKLWIPSVNQILETRHFWPGSSLLFESGEWPSMELKPNQRGPRNRAMTRLQLINVRNLSFLYKTRPEEVSPQKMHDWRRPAAMIGILTLEGQKVTVKGD